MIQVRHTQNLYLRIGELAARSGVSKQLIHYYLRRGYLHPAIYKRGNQAFYNETHLERLKFILRCKEEGIPLPFTIDLWERTGGLLVEEPARQKKEVENSSTREQIIELATRIFLTKGYGNTSIPEIMKAVGITKPSFYYYFENKRDLYLTCLDSTFEAFSAWTLEKIRREKNPWKRIEMRCEAAHSYTGTFLTAVNLLKESLHQEDEKERQRAEGILRRTWVDPLVKDLERGKEAGLFRELDSELMSLALISITETLVYRGIVSQKHGGEAILKAILDLMMRGLLNPQE
ncbi:MAG: TetR family transcriptional regulator [Firmicutes bacterium]|nr:TetR family transcriptional regulator [Bacillota bacterium]